jgi:hypothetical protein
MDKNGVIWLSNPLWGYFQTTVLTGSNGDPDIPLDLPLGYLCQIQTGQARILLLVMVCASISRAMSGTRKSVFTPVSTI